MRPSKPFKIGEPLSSARGRRLAALAIWIQVAVLMLFGVSALLLAAISGNPVSDYVWSLLIGLGFFLFIQWGIARAFVLVGALYALIAVFSLYYTITTFDFTSGVGAIADFSAAVLDFVALSGIVIWFRNRTAPEQNNRVPT